MVGTGGEVVSADTAGYVEIFVGGDEYPTYPIGTKVRITLETQ